MENIFSIPCIRMFSVFSYFDLFGVWDTREGAAPQLVLLNSE